MCFRHHLTFTCACVFAGLWDNFVRRQLAHKLSSPFLFSLLDMLFQAVGVILLISNLQKQRSILLMKKLVSLTLMAAMLLFVLPVSTVFAGPEAEEEEKPLLDPPTHREECVQDKGKNYIPQQSVINYEGKHVGWVQSGKTPVSAIANAVDEPEVLARFQDFLANTPIYSHLLVGSKVAVFDLTAVTGDLPRHLLPNVIYVRLNLEELLGTDNYSDVVVFHDDGPRFSVVPSAVVSGELCLEVRNFSNFTIVYKSKVKPSVASAAKLPAPKPVEKKVEAATLASAEY